jgi:4-hydroxy-2-oxoglutarate aldolase
MDLVSKLKGILLPVVTPFDEQMTLDHQALAENLSLWGKTSVTGFVIAGSTGERVHLDESEYLQLIETSRAATPPEFAFIVGAGQQSTIGTINEVRRAARAGADAVLVITPHFYRTAITQEVLIDYYCAVADAAPVRVLLYSMPAHTGVKIEPETIASLSEHPNIIGVKDSSNDVEGFSRTVRLCPADFAVLTGNGTVLLDALRARATGGILAVGCVVPELCVEIVRMFRSGEVEHAERLQSKLTPLAAAVTTRFGIGGLKAALDLAGYRGGFVRKPLSTANDKVREELMSLINEAKSSLTQSRKGAKEDLRLR